MHIGLSEYNISLTFLQGADSECSQPGCVSVPTMHYPKGPCALPGDRERYTSASASGTQGHARETEEDF